VTLFNFTVILFIFYFVPVFHSEKKKIQKEFLIVSLIDSICFG